MQGITSIGNGGSEKARGHGEATQRSAAPGSHYTSSLEGRSGVTRAGVTGGLAAAIVCHTRWELELWGDATPARDAALRREGGGEKAGLSLPHPLISCLPLAELIGNQRMWESGKHTLRS